MHLSLRERGQSGRVSVIHAKEADLLFGASQPEKAGQQTAACCPMAVGPDPLSDAASLAWGEDYLGPPTRLRHQRLIPKHTLESFDTVKEPKAPHVPLVL